MNGTPRWIGLPLAAVLLVGGVVGVQLAHGGGSYEPFPTADPCAERVVTSTATGIDGLTERLVLLGVDAAACTLGVSREALTLELAKPGARTGAEVDALHDGLVTAVRRMKADATLPPTSELADEALESADLNGLLKAALRALPAGVIDAALPTDDLLVRAIDGLDLRAVLADLDDRADLEQQVEAAVVQAVRDSLLDRVRDLL